MALTILSRASKSVPFSTAFGKYSRINSIAPAANTSVTAYAPGVTIDSIACVNASIPVAAVNDFGIVNINSGSFTEIFRQAVFVDHNHLHFAVFIGDDVVDRDFSGCSGSRVDRHNRQAGFSGFVQTFVVLRFAAVRQDDADGARCILRRAATEGK